MTSIIKAGENDALLLSEIAKLSFLESHGNCAEAEDVNIYVTEKYSEDILKKELQDPANIYYILYLNNKAVGYSKIILNSPYPNSKLKNITKLERLYLLKEFYDLHLGSVILAFNIHLAKENGQTGMWLFVWKENERAVSFYTKHGFIITGSHDFKISENHSNPNHQMLLSF